MKKPGITGVENLNRELKRSDVIKNKSAHRKMIIDEIVEALKNPKIYQTIDYQKRKEDYIKQYMHQFLIKRIEKIYSDLNPKLSNKTVKMKAEKALLWEGDKNTTINNFLFLGTQHRPDFLIKIDGLTLAVEIKRGQKGSDIREGVGQSLVYAFNYDFVIYIFIDTSKDKKILTAINGDNFPKEKFLIESLWENYNIRFSIV